MTRRRVRQTRPKVARLLTLTDEEVAARVKVGTMGVLEPGRRGGREVAALLPSITLVYRAGRFTLRQAGHVVSTWREQDAPDLGGWLSNFLPVCEMVAAAARVEASTHAKRVAGAKKGGAAKARTADAARVAIARQARAIVAAGNDLASYVATWADEYDLHPDSVRRIIRKALR